MLRRPEEGVVERVEVAALHDRGPLRHVCAVVVDEASRDPVRRLDGRAVSDHDTAVPVAHQLRDALHVIRAFSHRQRARLHGQARAKHPVDSLREVEA